MVVVFPGQHPITRHQMSIHKECGHTIYPSVEDKSYDFQEEPLVTAHSGVYHYSPTTIISKRELKKYQVSKFLEHCQPALQVTASLEKFSDLSDADGST